MQSSLIILILLIYFRQRELIRKFEKEKGIVNPIDWFRFYSSWKNLRKDLIESGIGVISRRYTSTTRMLLILFPEIDWKNIQMRYKRIK